MVHLPYFVDSASLCKGGHRHLHLVGVEVLNHSDGENDLFLQTDFSTWLFGYQCFQGTHRLTSNEQWMAKGNTKIGSQLVCHYWFPLLKPLRVSRKFVTATMCSMISSSNRSLKQSNYIASWESSTAIAVGETKISPTSMLVRSTVQVVSSSSGSALSSTSLSWISPVSLSPSDKLISTSNLHLRFLTQKIQTYHRIVHAEV